MQNRKRMKKPAPVDQFGMSNASSGRWRKPIGGASAGLSDDGGNSFSIVTGKDVASAFNPYRPSMMFQTMYSLGGGGLNQLDSTPFKDNQTIVHQNDNERGHNQMPASPAFTPQIHHHGTRIPLERPNKTR